jgi:hypothetical protein
MQIQGDPLLPFLLVRAAVAQVGAVPLAGESVDLQPATAQVIWSGVEPGLPSLFANTGAAGIATFSLPPLRLRSRRLPRRLPGGGPEPGPPRGPGPRRRLHALSRRPRLRLREPLVRQPRSTPRRLRGVPCVLEPDHHRPVRSGRSPLRGPPTQPDQRVQPVHQRPPGRRRSPPHGDPRNGPCASSRRPASSASARCTATCTRSARAESPRGLATSSRRAEAGCPGSSTAPCSPRSGRSRYRPTARRSPSAPTPRCWGSRRSTASGSYASTGPSSARPGTPVVDVTPPVGASRPRSLHFAGNRLHFRYSGGGAAPFPLYAAEADPAGFAAPVAAPGALNVDDVMFNHAPSGDLYFRADDGKRRRESLLRERRDRRRDERHRQHDPLRGPGVRGHLPRRLRPHRGEPVGRERGLRRAPGWLGRARDVTPGRAAHHGDGRGPLRPPRSTPSWTFASAPTPR